MKHIKVLLILSISICFVAFFIWAEEYTEYTSNKLGISFNYPEDWQREEQSFEVVVLSPEWAYDGREKAAFGIQMTPLDYTEEKTLEEYFAELKQENNYIYGEPGTVMINETEWFHVEVAEPEINIAGELYLLKVNNALYLMAVAYQPPESGERFRRVLDTIIKSVRIVSIE